MTTPDDMGQEILLELRKSASAVDYDHIDRLIAGGANLSALNDLGQPPLVLSIAHGFSRASLAFIKAGADVELGSVDSPPLHLAAYYGAITTFQMLLDRGATLDRLDAKGRTPLQVAEEKRISREDVSQKFPRLNGAKANAEIENLQAIEKIIGDKLFEDARDARNAYVAQEKWRKDGLPLQRGIKVRQKPVRFKNPG